jgi:phage terminase large subunit-like protein
VTATPLTLSSERSLAQIVADLPEADREAMLAEMDEELLAYDPQFWLRPTQLRPINETDWNLAEMIAGRGAGKTRSMCEWSRKKAQGPPTRGALVARTAADVRDVLVAGESGILAISPPSERPEYEPSKRLLTWPNGTTALCFSSEAPDQLRGPQFHWALADEIASWKYLPDESGLTAWDNLRLATRLGELPQIFAGTTPKRTPFMRALIKAAEDETGVLLLRGSTKDNRGNLSQRYIDMIYGLYAGTALAAQELEGVMLDDIDGALWDEALIEANRVLSIPKMRRPIVAVGVDPSVSEKPGDETGIIVAVVDGAIRDMFKRHAYILSDASLQAAPEIWAKVLAAEAERFGNAPIIAETNQGGGLIKAVLTGINPRLKVLGVHSRFGKAIRAEPACTAGLVRLSVPNPWSSPHSKGGSITWGISPSSKTSSRAGCRTKRAKAPTGSTPTCMCSPR